MVFALRFRRFRERLVLGGIGLRRFDASEFAPREARGFARHRFAAPRPREVENENAGLGGVRACGKSAIRAHRAQGARSAESRCEPHGAEGAEPAAAKWILDLGCHCNLLAVSFAAAAEIARDESLLLLRTRRGSFSSLMRVREAFGLFFPYSFIFLSILLISSAKSALCNKRLLTIAQNKAPPALRLERRPLLRFGLVS